MDDYVLVLAGGFVLWFGFALFLAYTVGSASRRGAADPDEGVIVLRRPDLHVVASEPQGRGPVASGHARNAA